MNRLCFYFGTMSKINVLICIGASTTTRSAPSCFGLREDSGLGRVLSSTLFHFNLSSLSTFKFAPSVTSSTEVILKAVNSLSSSTLTS